VSLLTDGSRFASARITKAAGAQRETKLAGSLVERRMSSHTLSLLYAVTRKREEEAVKPNQRSKQSARARV